MALQKATQLLRFAQNKSSGAFEHAILTNSSINRVWEENGRVFIEFSLTVLPQFSNAYGPLHGGAITTIVDELTALAVWTADRTAREMTSCDLSVSFASAAYEGEVLNIIAKSDKVGKTLAFASAELWSGSKLVATGKHTLYMLGTPLAGFT